MLIYIIRESTAHTASGGETYLELQELAHRVVHRAPPHDRLHDRREVVVHEDDIGGGVRCAGQGDAGLCARERG